MANPGILTDFDFTAIEEMDPSLAEGFATLYDKELPFLIRQLQHPLSFLGFKMRITKFKS